MQRLKRHFLAIDEASSFREFSEIVPEHPKEMATDIARPAILN